jgi:ABC-type phosphate/phosphonate transport system substrate-binding protein
LAWVKVHHFTHGTCQALAMRDVDARFTTVFVVRADSGLNTLADLRGKRVALGSADSVQAAILPVHCLQEAGVEPANDCTLVRFDLDVGKHGDTGTSELEVLRALDSGSVDAGAMAESTWLRQVGEGKIDAHRFRAIWRSPGYCHCVFTALGELGRDQAEHWTRSLLAMKYEDPRWRSLMDMEGLRRWIRPDAAILEGYRILFAAVKRQDLARNWLL